MSRAPFDKYAHYLEAVQSPRADAKFFAQTYHELRRKKAYVLREDFCGTFALACAWVKLDPKNEAVAVDLDPEPLEYGQRNYLSKLKAEQRERVSILQQSVMMATGVKSDVIAAMNFSYCLMKSRLLLRTYFRRCRQGLKPNGIFILDCFGGPACMESNEDRRRSGNFTYFWDQESFDPISNHGVFHIHFKRRNERKRKYVFSYDWRLWTIPELREIMLEAGFKKTHIYWEGDTREGEGNGIFRRREKGQECDAWVAYIVGEK